jgi:hypothetical protein
MDEPATFKARAVLGPRRDRLTRLGLLLPVVALVAIVWAGLSGARPDRATAEIAAPRASPVATPAPPPQPPAQVVGLTVHRLDDVQPLGLGRDQEIAVAGWYVATAITDCPPLAAIYRQGSLPEIRGDADSWAFCDRSGVLYASQPGLDEHQLANDPADNGAGTGAGVFAVSVTIVIGVVAPPELEVIGTVPTEVVVVGRFVGSAEPCQAAAGCRPQFVVDHVGWTPDA